MAAAKDSVRVCENCGSPIETTASGDIGCMVCLLDAVLDRDAESQVEFAPAPDQIGVYTIEHRADGSASELGHGAMGVTYRAIDNLLGRPVALKIINTERGSHSAEARERFMREARSAAALRHPNVATVYQFGIREETGQLFYAMELVEGETLEERVRRLGPLDVLTTIDVALQVTAALEAAEEHGLVHRDLKPGNLMLVSSANDVVGALVPSARRLTQTPLQRTTQRSSVQVKVIDFGVAKAISEKTNAMALTHGGFVGTPAFASPEQFTSAQVDVRSDIYSLGATLWFLLTGHMLFSGRTVEEIQESRRSKPLPIEQLKAACVPRRFVSLLMSMLAIEPAARPAGARQLAAKLQAIRASITGRRKAVQRFALAAAVIALLTIVGIRVFRSRPATSVASPIPEKSIAVLPFANLSRDPDNAYFADGMQDEILARLSKIADLKVISRTSTQRLKSAPGDLRGIARQLGVANILEGSVQKAADQVRVNVQLINALNDVHLWSDIYDRKLTDIFAVESDIAKTIADTLQAKLTGSEKQIMAAQPTGDTTAYELYLKGRLLWEIRGGDNLRQAIAFYEQAIARDPNYAQAYAGLANAYVILPTYTEVAPQEAYSKAKAAALKALQLDEKLAEAHTALAYTLYRYSDMTGSISEFQRAIAMNPNDATAHHWYGNNPLLALGRFDEAIAEGKRAIELDPRSPIINADLGQTLMVARRYDEAIAQLHKTLEIDPTSYFAHYHLGIVLQLKGDMPAAIAEYTKAQQLSDDLFVQVLLAAAKAQSGDKDAAMRMLTQLEELSQRHYVRGYWRALLYLSLGNRDEAIRWLEQSIVDHEGPPIPLGFKVNPLLDPLRNDPRFQKLCEEKRN